jgi:squalene-hopene/tetraprenyl-beta-curcumene cyclase
MNEIPDNTRPIRAAPPNQAGPAGPDLEQSIQAATKALLDRQQPDGHWVFELEADATISAEYVLLTHFLGESADIGLEGKIAAYLRRIQGAHGGWPLFHDGPFDMSASVKAYFALKMIGDSPAADHMRRARETILARGGAAGSNVFTHILLALFGIVPWRCVPVMPVEIMLLPSWFPFHLSKISYWARTVIVPLLILQAFKPVARNPRGTRVDEIFIQPPLEVRRRPRAPHQRRLWFLVFGAIDTILRFSEPLMPSGSRRRAVEAAVAFIKERLNGQEGLGAIFPAMANAVMAFDALGYAEDHPDRRLARAAIDRLLVVHDGEAYCQPCMSPVWDTALTCHALMETGAQEAVRQAARGLDWLRPLQILDTAGDWAARRKDVEPGGWAFQYTNPHYPDLDDTAVVVMAMDRAAAPRFNRAVDRGRAWIAGLQSRDGGWGAYDADNIHEYLNNIPFADHGALLDPPTADVTARCLSMLAQLGGRPETDPAMAAGADFLRRNQLADGSWYGRWGMNHIYGTWSALCALSAIGMDRSAPEIRKGADFLLSVQNPDGGWGEDGASYKLDYRGHEVAPSTIPQTAWAVLGLLAAGESNHPAVERGISYLMRSQSSDGKWSEARSTATGFPRVFYLHYHGYAQYFPLWALARYRNIKEGNAGPPALGM